MARRLWPALVVQRTEQDSKLLYTRYSFLLVSVTFSATQWSIIPSFLGLILRAACSAASSSEQVQNGNNGRPNHQEYEHADQPRRNLALHGTFTCLAERDIASLVDVSIELVGALADVARKWLKRQKGVCCSLESPSPKQSHGEKGRTTHHC